MTEVLEFGIRIAEFGIRKNDLNDLNKTNHLNDLTH